MTTIEGADSQQKIVSFATDNEHQWLHSEVRDQVDDDENIDLVFFVSIKHNTSAAEC